MELAAVIFDMDGVLCRTDEYHYRSWKDMADAYHLPFNRDANEKLRGLTRRRSLELILGGRSAPEEQVQAMMAYKDRRFQRLIRDMTPEALAEGVAGLLQELDAVGMKIGVASASRNVEVVLGQLGIGHFIQAYCDGKTTQKSKPDPFSYLYTAKALRANPASCLAIEDSEAGIQAALSAGMCVIGIGSGQRVSKAHAVFKSLAGVQLRDLKKVFDLWRDGNPNPSVPPQNFLQH